MKLCPGVTQSADHDPFMPDSDREGLNTVRAQRSDDLVEVCPLTCGSCQTACWLWRILQRCVKTLQPLMSEQAMYFTCCRPDVASRFTRTWLRKHPDV